MLTEVLKEKKNFFFFWWGGVEREGFPGPDWGTKKTLQDLVAIVLIQVIDGSRGPSLFNSQLAKGWIKTRCPNGALLLTLQVGKGRDVSP